MTSQELTQVWEYSKGMSIKYYDSGVLVDQLADLNHLLNSALTFALHAVISNLFFDVFELIFFGIFSYPSTCTNCPNHFITFTSLTTSNLAKYPGLSTDASLYY